jgi:hypothetical protein
VNLSTSSKITRVSNAVAAGTATTNCSAVDMKGFESVTFVVAIGAIVSTGTVTVKAQQSTDNSSFADLEGTAIAYTDSDDNKLAVLEITKATRAICSGCCYHGNSQWNHRQRGCNSDCGQRRTDNQRFNRCWH